MTPLARHLAERIRATGPMPLSDYMAEALMHPTHGYYATRDPFGAGGDFITAPEITQMFGELVGLCLAQAWLDQGSPAPFTLAELGPGRGTLMADAWRATARVPGFHAAARLHLVEQSPTLRARQRDALAGLGVTWHDGPASLPDAPLFLIANEFFDALPIRQFVRQGAGWAERQLGLSPEGSLIWGLSPAGPVTALDHRLADTAEAGLVELCPALPAIATPLAATIARRGGVAVAIDYGHWRSLGDTLQAVAAHRAADPLAAPGEADLTAHVDFEALARAFAAGGAAVTAMERQGTWLLRLGLAERTERLAARLTGAALANHRAAFTRLTAPGQMGDLFRVIACHPPGTAVPAGLTRPPEHRA